MAATYEVLGKEEGNWHVAFKLAPENNLKMVMLADLGGQITDFNLLSTNTLRKRHQEPLTIAQLGVHDVNATIQAKHGSSVHLNLAGVGRKCQVHI